MVYNPITHTHLKISNNTIIHKTKATTDSQRSFYTLCVLFQKNHCKQGDFCQNIHIDLHIVKYLNTITNTQICCPYHDKNNTLIKDNRSISFNDIKIEVKYITPTNFNMDFYFKKNYKLIPSIHICRLFLSNRCSYLNQCNHLHICPSYLKKIDLNLSDFLTNKKNITDKQNIYNNKCEKNQFNKQPIFSWNSILENKLLKNNNTTKNKEINIIINKNECDILSEIGSEKMSENKNNSFEQHNLENSKLNVVDAMIVDNPLVKSPSFKIKNSIWIKNHSIFCY